MIGIGGDVLEDLKFLIDLQEVDQRIHRINKNKERLPRLVKLAGETLRDAEAARDAAQEAYDTVTKERRESEAKIQDETELLKKLKLRSTEIKTNKEYFAHLKEIEECQKRISKLEESVLALMEGVEKAEAELSEKKRLAADEESKFTENKANIEKRFEADDKALAELTARREELLPKISKEAVGQYREVHRLYPDSAVVEAVNGNCTGCRMTIPPQVFNNVKKGESVIMCYNCRRILFFKGQAS